MKVKIFKFSACDCRYRNSNFEKITMNPADVEAEINRFIRGKSIISITPSVVEERIHNNGGYNTVSLVYTILYEAPNEEME